ncbi:site-specific integrase [Propionicicella superfundia]|uniref:site-specific integrase n=1 Tax=Propionicicella superfundia TaxID=348582 RepID=UPI000A03F315|nr:site-specific integrase [Propionicicella superfundia]
MTSQARGHIEAQSFSVRHGQASGRYRAAYIHPPSATSGSTGSLPRRSTTGCDALAPGEETIVEELPERDKFMALLAAWCALRFGELTELRRKDIDLRNKRAKVTRGVCAREEWTPRTLDARCRHALPARRCRPRRRDREAALEVGSTVIGVRRTG